MPRTFLWSTQVVVMIVMVVLINPITMPQPEMPM